MPVVGNASEDTLLALLNAQRAPAAPVTITTGRCTTVANTVVPLNATATACPGGIMCQADPGNAQPVRVAGLDVAATTGTVLAPGGGMGWDRVSDASTIGVLSTVNGDHVTWTGTT